MTTRIQCNASDRRDLLDALRCYERALGDEIGTLHRLGADDAASAVTVRFLRVGELRADVEAGR